MDGIPGPAAYKPIDPIFYKERRNPEYKIGLRFKGPRQDSHAPKQVPPISIDLYKRRAPAFVMGQKFSTRRQIPPGGNDDGFLKKHVVLRSSPAFTIGDKLQSKKYRTSPKIQNLQYYDPYRRGPAFTFGVKHSEFTQNPIVPCDNYWR